MAASFPVAEGAAKPKPKDFSHYLSFVTAARQASTMKQYYKYFTPAVGNLAGGTFWLSSLLLIRRPFVDS